jgi:DNA-binding NarL/FixJ family response regulator
MSGPRAIRLLLAVDHQVVREGMRMMLGESSRGSGGKIEIVGEAATGDAALAEAARLRPDVVLMDLQMPGLDGIEATRRIRSAGTAGGVLILTTFADDDRIRESIQAGAIGYILKDVLKDDLVLAIRAAARGMPTLDPRAQLLLMRQVTEPAPQSPFGVLTPRELDVLRLVAGGKSNKLIAATLFLSVGTVKGYVSAILPKLGVADRTQAALFAAKHGLE